MPHIEIAAEKLGTFLSLPITNTLVHSWLAVILLILLARTLSRNIDIVPGSVQNLFEMILGVFMNLMEGVLGTKEKAEKYLPLVFTIFLFVLVSNWLGIFPGVGPIGLKKTGGGETLIIPFLRSAASDLNFTLALGVSAVIFINLIGAAAIGIGKHVGRFISFKGPIEFFIGILELISEGAKMISFSFRLFGNILAGEVLLVIIAFLVPFIAPLPFLALEIFVGFIQALVFSMLTMVFISIATAEHGGH